MSILSIIVGCVAGYAISVSGGTPAISLILGLLASITVYGLGTVYIDARRDQRALNAAWHDSQKDSYHD